MLLRVTRPTAALRLLGLCLALTGCGDQKEAEAILDQIQDEDYRNTYARAPGWAEALLPSQGGPHGAFIDLYVNDVLADALADAEASGEGLTQWPEGSLIVKDGFNDAEGTDLKFVSLMEKRGGDDWFWAEYDDRLKVEFAGLNDSTCTGCHSAGQDSVLAFDLP